MEIEDKAPKVQTLVFQKEKEKLEQSREWLTSEKFPADVDFKKEFIALLNNYEYLLNEAVKITGISDIYMHKLIHSNDTIEKQNQELKKYKKHLTQLVQDRSKELEEKHEQLLHSQRLASLGEIASAIVHEINQPLAIIHAEAELMKMNAEKPIDHLGDFILGTNSIIEEIQRTTKILDNMHKFTRETGDITLPINIHDPIEVGSSFLKKQFYNHNIELRINYEPNLPLIDFQQQRFEQVVVNLLSNAHYAVEKKAENIPENYQMNIDINVINNISTDQIIFEVKDNGIGMDQEELSKCLSPFYTTKKESEHTGLGLSIVNGIVNEFNSIIEIDSEKNVGTTVRIKIPAHL